MALIISTSDYGPCWDPGVSHMQVALKYQILYSTYSYLSTLCNSPYLLGLTPLTHTVFRGCLV